MQTRHIAPDPASERLTPERCHILELLGGHDDGAVSIARARVEPGVETQRHSLAVDERYVMLAGTGEATIGESRFTVGTGDVLLIPRDTPQSIVNTGDDELVFLCICTPPFTPDCYSALGS